jgi:hypothetical protein
LEDQDFIIPPEDARLMRRKRRISVIGSPCSCLQFFSAFSAHDLLAMPLEHGRRDAMLRRWTDAHSEAMAAYQLSPVHVLIPLRQLLRIKTAILWALSHRR